jgi:ribosomal protein S7
MGHFKLKARNIYVHTNLEVRLKSRTTKEEANKEVERMVEKRKLFESYEWKIEGCEEGGINSFDEKLANDIIERIEQEETDENIFWDGFTAHYDLNVGHIPVNTNLEIQLNSATKEEAVTEAKKIVAEKTLLEGYEWKIENCDETGVNDLNESLKNEILEIIAKDPDACIEESA